MADLTTHGASDVLMDLSNLSGVYEISGNGVTIYAQDGNIVVESDYYCGGQIVRINGIALNIDVRPGKNVYPVDAARGDIILVRVNGEVKKIRF